MQFSKFVYILTLATFVASILVIDSHVKLSAQNSTSVDLFPVTSKPYGLSYEDHLMNYNKYILSIPVDKNPAEDPTGERCTYGQDTSNSSLFYLNGNSGGVTEKTCAIPEGLALFIPLITVEASAAENPGATITDLHEIAKDDQDSVNSLYLKINDKEFKYEDLLKYRTHTKDFQVTFPENAFFGAPPGPTTVVADGYHVITEPLAAGNYTIQFKGSLVCLEADCTEPIFATDNIYKLIVR